MCYSDLKWLFYFELIMSGIILSVSALNSMFFNVVDAEVDISIK